MNNESNRTVSAPLDTQDEHKSDFLKHLAESSKAIEGWPEWKTGLWKADSGAPLDTQALPPLPEPDTIAYTCIGDNDAYSPQFVKQVVAQRDARIAHLERELKQAKLQQLADLGQDIERELAEHKPAPEGYVLAPLCSTGEMDKAGLAALPSDCYEVDAERCYAAMIAAAPSPQSKQEEAE